MGALFSVAVLVASCSSPEPSAEPRADPPVEAEVRPSVGLTAPLRAPVPVDESRTRFVAGGVRVEVQGEQWILARDLFTGQIQAAVPIEGGWLFAADPGIVAKSATFTGELEVLGSLASEVGAHGIAELGLVDDVFDYRLYLTDGSGPPAPVEALEPHAVLGVSWTSRDHAVAQVDDGWLESHDHGRTWQRTRREPRSPRLARQDFGRAWSPFSRDAGWRDHFAEVAHALQPDEAPTGTDEPGAALVSEGAPYTRKDERTLVRRDPAGAETVVLALEAEEYLHHCAADESGATCAIQDRARGPLVLARLAVVDGTASESFVLPPGTFSVVFADRRHAVARAATELFHTIDGGRRWEPSHAPVGSNLVWGHLDRCTDDACFVASAVVRFAPLPPTDGTPVRVFGPPDRPARPERPTYSCELAPSTAPGSIAFASEADPPHFRTLVSATWTPPGAAEAQVARGSVALQGEVAFREIARSRGGALALGCGSRSHCALLRLGGSRIATLAEHVVAFADLGERFGVYRSVPPYASIATHTTLAEMGRGLAPGDGFVADGTATGVYFYGGDHRIVIVFADGERRTIEADLDAALATPCASLSEGVRLFPHRSGEAFFDLETQGRRYALGTIGSPERRLDELASAELRIVDGRACLAKIAGLDAQPDGTLVGPMALADGSTARASCRPTP